MNIGAVSKATLGKHLRAGVERNNYGVFRAHRYHLELSELNRTGRAGAGKQTNAEHHKDCMDDATIVFTSQSWLVTTIM